MMTLEPVHAGFPEYHQRLAMDERWFWPTLEFRISRECEGNENRHIQNLWCDGLIPLHYGLDSIPPCIRGDAYFGASGQEHWTFILELPFKPESVATIDWDDLLPPEDAEAWITIDQERKHLLLKPPPK